MSRLRRLMMGAGTVAVCLAAGLTAVVGSAGAQPTPTPKTPQQLRPVPILRPFHVTRIVPSDRVNFDVTAAGLAPGRQAEVQGGLTPSFVFNSPGGWATVTHVGTGHYCLNSNTAPFFNYPATVSVADRFGTANVPGALVQYDSFGAGCPGVGVFTYQIVS